MVKQQACSLIPLLVFPHVLLLRRRKKSQVASQLNTYFWDSLLVHTDRFCLRLADIYLWNVVHESLSVSEIS